MKQSLKICSVCHETFEEDVKIEDKYYEDICPTCHDSFGKPEELKEEDAQDRESSNNNKSSDLSEEEIDDSLPVPETPEQKHKRLTEKSRELLFLQFCYQVLTQRIQEDASNAAFWELKIKITKRMASFLYNTLPEEYQNPSPALTEQEKTQTLQTHPLLQTIDHEPADNFHFKPGQHLAEIRSRVKQLTSRLAHKR